MPPRQVTPPGVYQGVGRPSRTSASTAANPRDKNPYQYTCPDIVPNRTRHAPRKIAGFSREHHSDGASGYTSGHRTNGLPPLGECTMFESSSVLLPLTRRCSPTEPGGWGPACPYRCTAGESIALASDRPGPVLSGTRRHSPGGTTYRVSTASRCAAFRPTCRPSNQEHVNAGRHLDQDRVGERRSCGPAGRRGTDQPPHHPAPASEEPVNAPNLIRTQQSWK